MSLTVENSGYYFIVTKVPTWKTQNPINRQQIQRLIGFIQLDGNIESIILSPEIISCILFRDI